MNGVVDVYVWENTPNSIRLLIFLNKTNYSSIVKIVISVTNFSNSSSPIINKELKISTLEIESLLGKSIFKLEKKDIIDIAYLFGDIELFEEIIEQSRLTRITRRKKLNEIF